MERSLADEWLMLGFMDLRQPRISQHTMSVLLYFATCSLLLNKRWSVSAPGLEVDIIGYLAKELPLMAWRCQVIKILLQHLFLKEHI